MWKNNNIKKKSVYRLDITPEISNDDLKKFNTQILSGLDANEYKKYDNISKSIEKAKSSLDEYYAECVKINRYATKDEYSAFVNEKIASRVYDKSGITQTLDELNKLRLHVRDTYDAFNTAQTAFNTALSTTYKDEYNAGMSVTGATHEDVIGILAANHEDFKVLNDDLNNTNAAYKQASSAAETYTTVVASNNQALGQYIRSNQEATLSVKEFNKQNRAAKLSNFFKGAGSMLLNGAVSMGIGIILSMLVSGIQSLITAEKDRRKEAIQSAEALDEENQSLKEQEERIKKLREELAKGTLSEEEAYNARKELIEIQDKLKSSYGTEAEGIDLVNGGLEEQLGLLQNISKEKARDYISENAKAIEDARKKLSKNVNESIYWGQVTNGKGNEDEMRTIQVALRDYFRQYAQDTGKIEVLNDQDKQAKNAEDIDYNIKGTSQDIIDAWDSAYDYIEEYGKQMGIDVTNVLTAISEHYINKLKEKYGESYDFLYDNAAPQEIAADDNLTAYYKELTDAITEYNEAVASGDSPDTAIDKIFALREKLLNDEVTDQYGNTIEDEVLQYFADMFTKYLDSVNVSNFKSYLSQMSKTEKNNLFGAFDTMTDLDVKNMENNTHATKEQLEAYERIKNYADEYDISVDEAIDAMTSLGIITGDVANKAERTATAFKKMAEEISDTQTGLDKFNSAYEKILTNENLTAAETNELIQLDPALVDKFTQTADGYTIALEDLATARKKYANVAANSQLNEVSTLREEISENEKKLKETQEKRKRLNKELLETSQEREQLLRTGIAVDENLSYRNGVWNPETQTVDIVPNTKDFTKTYTGYIKKLEDGTVQLTDAFTQGAEYVKDMRILTDNVMSKWDNKIISIENGIQNCVKQEDDYTQRIKDGNEEIKQRNILIQQLLAASQRNWKSDFNTVYEKYSAMDQRGQTAQQEMASQGFLSAETAKDIIDNTQRWSECLTEVNGKLVFNAEKYQEIMKAESGYNKIVDDAEKYNDKLDYKTLTLKALAKGYHVVYDESKSYLENLEAVRAAAAKTNSADSDVMKNLDNLEAEYIGLETSVGDCNSALSVFLQLLGQIAEENKIDEILTDFEDKISEMKYKLSMGQITQDEYDSWYNSTWSSKRSQLDRDSLNEASKDKYDQFDEEDYSQRIAAQERAYDTEKTKLDNLLEDKYISYKDYYDKLQALNEKYYGNGSLLGSTEDGKKTYESNSRALADSAKNTYDDLMTRIDRAIDKNVIDDKLFAEIKAVFGNDIPTEVVNAINEAISTGKIIYEQSAVFSKYLSEEIMGSIPALADELQDAMDDIADRMKSEFDKQISDLDTEKSLTNMSAEEYWSRYENIRNNLLENDIRLTTENEEAKKNIQLNADKEIYDEKLNRLEQEKQKGNINTEEYWKQRKALAEKYLKNNAALTEDWIDEEISYAIDAQKDMYEEATSLFERQLKNGEIAWSKYIDGLWDNWKKFYAGKKGLEEESNTALNGILDAEKEAAQDQIDALENEKDRISEPYENQIQAIEDATEKMDKQYDHQINALQDKLDLLEKEEETNEKNLEIEEKRKALLDAQRNVYKSLRLVYDGNGNWVTKPTQESLDAVDEAQKALDEAEKEAADEALKRKIEAYIDSVQQEKDNFDSEQQKKIDDLNQELADIQKPLDDLIAILTLIAADQKNVDPEMLEQLLKSDKGKEALERYNGKNAEYQETYNAVINSDLTDKALQAAIDAELKKALPKADTSNMTPEEKKALQKRQTYFKDGVDRMSTVDEKDIDPTTVESAKAIVDELAKGNKTLIQQLIDIGYDIDGYFKDYFTNLLGISDSDDATSIINKMIAYLNEALDSDKTSFYSIFDAVGSSIFGDNWDNINKVISDLKTAQTENVATGSMEKSDSEQVSDEDEQLPETFSEQEKFTNNLRNANAELEKLNKNVNRYIPLSDFSESEDTPDSIKNLIAILDNTISATPILANLANKNNVGKAANTVINTNNTITPTINTNITVNASGDANEIAQAVGDVVDAKIVKSFQVFYDGYYNGSNKTMYGNN